MNRQAPSPESARTRITLIELHPERSCREDAAARVAAKTDGGGRGWHLDCRLESGGPWAGLRDLFLDLFDEIQEAAPELLQHHAYELAMAIPQLRGRVDISQLPLTDVAEKDELVRNYPMDRAFRMVHGLTELLAAWHQRDGRPWLIYAEGYSRAGALNQRFFHELVRRFGAMDLELVLAVAPGDRLRVEDRFSELAETRSLAIDGVPHRGEELDAAGWAERAAELKEQVGGNADVAEALYPDILRAYRNAGDDEELMRWQVYALGVCNHRGFYEDARFYLPTVLDGLAEFVGDDEEDRWNVVGNVFNTHVTINQPEAALYHMERYAVAEIGEPALVARVSYIMAMIYARFLPESNFDLAETYLNRGLELLESADFEDEGDRHFQTVFLMNGLALVRHRQGHPEDAIRLCQDGFDRLQEHLGSDRHRLHRSVLQYNTAQVYQAVGRHEEAVRQYTLALEMDPFYSEYYNDRGSLYLKMDRFDLAQQDFERAIELSPPYSEVWTNLGQCHRRQGNLEGALQAYDRALDLDPDVFLARLGRAQIRERAGDVEGALADYDRALEVDPEQPLLLANRATLRYEQGDVEASLEDLNRAVRLDPENPDLYRNRAVALEDLNRPQEAASDLANYLRLNPSAPDRDEVRQQVGALMTA